LRLPDFILLNIEPILVEWEAFARSIWPSADFTPDELRDDAEEILRAAVEDMRSRQTPREQSEKSMGRGQRGPHSSAFDQASATHGVGRMVSGFDLEAVIAEYRALRASVIRLWRKSEPSPDRRDLDDLTRFNESMDQSLTQAVNAFVRQVNHERGNAFALEKSLRAQAEDANRAKDQFLATLSHEIRTPLNAIVGWLPILRARDCNAEDLAEGLEVIERNAKAQVKLIDDVLDVSRIISGKLRVEPRLCEMCEIINAGIDAVRPAAEARNISLDVRLDPVANRGYCDPTRIQQVVWNLASNAVKFTPRGGRVGVTLGRDQSSLQIQVTDTGQGIEPTLLPHVFDPFRQGDSSTRRSFGGLGLGLSIVKTLVEAHGGTIEARSDGVGQGSTFTVRLPIQSVQTERAEHPPTRTTGDEDRAAHEDAQPQGQPPVRLHGVRVLIVDDEADARRLLSRLLDHVGAIPTGASSVTEALLALENAKPDVLISDLGMPGEDGYDLIRRVRQGGHGPRELPAIALTAFARKDDERQVLAAGYQIHVSKPVDPHELTAMIARLLSR
jgi:signal transduction histidine kinase